MPTIDPSPVIAGYATEGGLAVWKKVIDPENDERYAFVEDIMFSAPANDASSIPRLVEEYQRTLEAIGQAAVTSLGKLIIPDTVTVYLNDEDNFVTQSLPHIAAILKGDKQYLRYLSSKKSKSMRLISVRIEGVVVGNDKTASVYFNTKLLAIEANKKTGHFTVVEVIDMTILAGGE